MGWRCAGEVSIAFAKSVGQAKEKEDKVRAGCIIEQQKNRNETKKRKRMQKAKHVQMQWNQAKK